MLSEVVPGVGIEEVDGDNAQGQRDERNRRQRLPKVTLTRRAFHCSSGSCAALALCAPVNPNERDSTSFSAGEQGNGRRTSRYADFAKKENSDAVSGFAASNYMSLRFVTVLPSQPLLTIKLFSRRS